MSAASPIDSGEVFAVVPSYNHAPFVERCLRSIIKQSQPPRKLLVIDDGSRDASPATIERVLNDCPFPSELIVRENRGLSATLNQALELSSGEYFAYVGSDDVWLPDFLAERAKALAAQPTAVLAYGHAFLIDETDRIVDCTRDWARYLEGDALSNLLEGVVPVTSGVVFRRSALAGSSWNEQAKLEDYEMYLRLSRRGPFARCDDVLACWRKHSYNTSNEFATMFEEWIAAQNRVAGEVGLSDGALREAQRKLRFVAANIFLRHGEKRRAYRLFRGNWRSAANAAELFGMLARFGVPTPLLAGLQERRRRRRTAKYGPVTQDS